jgi:putative transposase
LLFLDETWTKTNMTRLNGWAPRGQRLIDKVPHGHWKTATFLAGLRNNRIEARACSTVRSTASAFAPMSSSS